MRPPDFTVGEPGAVYLERWWVIPRNRWCNVYLHRFLRSDDERALHDHPYYNVSILLRGAYLEHLNKGPHPCLGVLRDHLPTRCIPRHRGVGSTIFRRAATPHRIELFDGRPVWTLFLTGPRIREWGFHCPSGWRHWTVFTKAAAPGEAGLGCGEG